MRTSYKPKKKKRNGVVGRPKKLRRNRAGAGRRRVDIREASKSTKYRKALQIFETHDEECVRMIPKCTQDAFLNNSFSDESSQLKKHTVDSALAFYIENNYNKQTWINLVNDTKAHGCPMYPSYTALKMRMSFIQPIMYTKSEMEVRVSLESMLQTTVERLSESVASDWDEEDLHYLELITTIGFDSSSGHSNPHQKFKNKANAQQNSHLNLFQSCLSVIKLLSCKNGSDLQWINPSPQSIRFCRPLRIAFEKEDEEATVREYNRLIDEFNEMKKVWKFTLTNGKEVRVRFKVFTTLFDGKCLNVLVGNRATCRCPICGLTMGTFNNGWNHFDPDTNNFEFGLGLLHIQIKSFEHLLHLSYKKTVLTWTIWKKNKGILFGEFYCMNTYNRNNNNLNSPFLCFFLWIIMYKEIFNTYIIIII